MDFNSLSDDDLIALSSKNYDALSDDGLLFLSQTKPQKRNTTVAEDLQIGLHNAAAPIVKWAGMVGGAVPSYLGKQDAADSVYKTMDETLKSMEDYWVPKDAEQKTFAGKAIGTIGTLPMQLVSFPFSPADTGKTLVDAGEDGSWNSAAQGGAMLDTLGNVAGVALPGAIGGNLAKKFVSGAAINAGQETFMKKAIQNVAETEKGKAAFEPTWEGAGLAAITGGPMGMLTPSMNKTVDTQPNPYNRKADTTEPQVEAKAMTDVDNQIDVRRAEIKRIEEQLARQKDPVSEHAQSLHKDLLDETTVLNKLLAFKGELTTQNTPRTGVEAPRIDDQLRTEYSAREAEMEALQSEYRGLAKKGAVLSKAEKERLTSIEDRFSELSDYLEQNAAKVFGEEPPAKTEDTVVTPEKTEFVPAPDRFAVEDQILNKDYSTYSTDVLARVIENKNKKLTELAHIDDQDLLQRIAGERDHVQAVLNKRLEQSSNSNFDFNQVAGTKASWQFREPMLQALRERGIRGGLEVLAASKGDAAVTPYGKFIGELSQKLLDNPLVGGKGYVEDPNFPHDGGYHNISGYIHMKGDLTSSPHVFLHEVVHSAVNRALSLFDNGKLTDPKQVGAVRGIKNIYNSIRLDPNKLAIIKRFMGEDNTKIAMENTREFVAYGMSDQKFQLALEKIKLEGAPAYSKLANAIKNLLGLNKNERTALDDVLHYGEKLTEMSDGLPPGFDVNKKLDYHRINTPQDALAEIKSGSLKVFAHLFTQNLRQMMRNNPHFSAVEKQIAKAEAAKEYLIRDINHGLDAIKDWRKEGKYFYKTAGAEQSTALIPSMFDLKGTQIFNVYDTLMNGYRNSVDASETIKQNEGTWTPDEIKFAKAIDNGVNKLYEASIKMLASKGLDYTKLKQRIGYMLTSRVGDHAMQVRVNGILVRQQHFLTKAEAQHWAEVYKSQNKDSRVEVTTPEVSEIREGNATQSLKDFLDTLSTKKGKELEDFIDNTNAAMNEDNSNIGSHTLKSHIVGGYIGNQIGMSKQAMGEQLRTALPKMVDNYAQNIMSRSIQKDYLSYLIDNENKMDQTTKDLISFYTQTQIGQPFKEGSLSDTFRKGSNQVREAIDTFIDSNSKKGFHNRDKHAIDRFMGLFGNAFYISNILMKPSIWIAQPLQALNSTRSAFKEGETPRQVLSAFAETLVQLSVGKQYISKTNPELEKAIYRASQETNVLHPQMINDYNDMKVGTNPNSFTNQAIDTISGKKISAWGDKGSRYASFLFFYNLHKRSGLGGDELIRVASRDATENMVAYGSKKLPAIYREMGIVGEQGATLATFAHTQLGNMVVDLKEFAQKPSARTMAPMMMTAAVTMILGGAISLPILAEYELLRQLGVTLGWWTVKDWYNVSELIIDKAPRWASMGLLSDVTDIDMDASMRYTSLLNKLVDIEKTGLLAFSPHLAWGKEVVANTWDAFSPNSTVPERDQALKKVLPKGVVSGVVDQYRNDWDLFTGEGNPYTRTGSRGQGGVERDTAAKIAPFFGSQPTKQAMDMRKQLSGRERDKQAEALTEKAIQYFVHGDKERGNKAFDTLLTKYYQGDGDALSNGIENQIAKMNSTGLFGRYWSPKTGESTPAQRAAIIRDNLGEYLQRREGK